MLFTAIRPAILTLVRSIAGQGVFCYWRDQPASYVPPGSKTVCKLSLGPSGSVGWSESRISYDATQSAGQELAETVVNIQQFTLKILCECFDQSDGATAWNYLEVIRTRFSWTSSCDALKAVNVAYFSDADLQDLSRTVDNRVLSAANLDLRLRTTATETDSAHRFPFIETVNITGNLGS